MKQVKLDNRLDNPANDAACTASDIRGTDDLRKRMDYLNRCFLNGTTPEHPATQSALLDDYFRNSFGSSISGLKLNLINNPYAIIATGGYGRNEVCRHPDVSVLFIFKNSIPDGASGLIREIVYPLWDLGFNINYTTRTVKECLSNASKDYGYLSSLMDARFICGASLLYTMLAGQVREKILFSRKKEVVEWLYKRDVNRHLRFGSDAYLPEPDLVYSPGGLKDYHSMISAMRILNGPSDPKDLELSGFLSWKEYEDLEDSLAFIRRSLRFLYIFTGRKNSRLSQNHMGTVAGFMNYSGSDNSNSTELYFSELYRHMKTISELYYTFYLTVSHERVTGESPSVTEKSTESRWLSYSRGQVGFSSAAKLKKHPVLLMDLISECIKLNAHPEPEAIRLVKEFLYLADDTYISRHHLRFEELIFSMDCPDKLVFTILDTGLLSAFIPEFNTVHFLKRTGFYHIHPVCRHLLLTLVHLKQMVRSQDIEPELATTLSNKENRSVVLWAGLLHHLKYLPADREDVSVTSDIAGQVLKRFGKAEPFISRVKALIESQHLLDHTVTYRDYNDTTTVRHCLTLIPDHGLLDLLYIFTIANLKATGPSAWNHFRSHDLSGLRRAWSDATASDKRSEKNYYRIIDSFPSALKDRTGCHTPDCFTRRYLDSFSEEEIKSHATLAFSEGTSDVRISVTSSGETRCVTIISPCSPNPLPSAYGVFALHSIDVYDCRVFTWNTTTALLVFRVSAPKDDIFENDTWASFKRQLASSITGKKPLKSSWFRFQDIILKHRSGQPCIRFSKAANCDYQMLEIHGQTTQNRILTIIETICQMNHAILFVRITDGNKGPLVIIHVQQACGNLLTRQQSRKLIDELKSLKKV